VSLYDILACYVVVSLVIGAFSGTRLYFKIRSIDPEEFQKDLECANNNLLDELSQRGHVQKEVYGERTVYYEKNVLGRAANSNQDVIRGSVQKNPRRMALFMSMAGVIYIAIAWPKVLCAHLFASSSKDVNSNR
jgi:hypothetical protein